MKIYTNVFDLAKPTPASFSTTPYSDFGIGVKVVNNGVAVDADITVDVGGVQLTAEDNKVGGFTIYSMTSEDVGATEYTVTCSGQKFKLKQIVDASSVLEKKTTEIITNYVLAIGNVADGVLSRTSTSDIVEIDDSALKGAFSGNTNILNVGFQNLTTVGEEGMKSAFSGCTALKTVDLSKLSSVGTDGLDGTFSGCTALEIVLFQSATAVPTITETTFSNTNETFKVIVPDALYEDWVAADNWSNISEQIVKVSDYVVVMTNYGGYDNMDENN